jgi:PAS domain S-box-containing protein
MIVESVKDYAIFMLDLQGNIITWNAGAERIKGYKASEIIGRHFSIFYPEEAVRAGKCERALEAVLRDGRVEDEGFRVRKDGSLFWANVVLTVLYDEQGRAFGIAKVTRDLSERRHAEQERLRLAQEREANRVKDEFLSMISHELRTPLMAILGWSTLLQSRITDPESAKALNTIRRNAQAQARIIDDILDLSDVVNGKLRIDVQVMDLTEVVCETLATAKPLAEAKRLTLIEDIAPRVFMRGDATRLQHVVWNILSNAIKFTSIGGQIEIALLQNDEQQAVLRVRDTGRGIDPAFLPYVFEPFRQADVSSTRAFGGLGLGLSLVRRIAELHNGRVTVHSEGLDRGTTIELSLPMGLATADQQPLPSRAAAPARPLEGLRVLVVDDEADARDLLTALLARHGAAVNAADSAAQARELLSSTQPHVLLSDIGMPDEDGYDLMRSVRALPGERAGTPAIALTAYTRAEDRRRAFAAGFNDHLPKPVDPQELVRLIRGLSRSAAPANV